MTRSVLFVDDEPKILDGLNRMLRPLRQEWSMGFAAGGPDALARFADRPYDVIVSDMRMPGMDGDELLAEIRRLYPRTLRIVLTGEAHRDAMVRVIGVAHRVLTKPLDADRLKDVIRRSCQLRDVLRNQALEELIGRIGSVPSPPGLYARVVDAFDDPDMSIDDLAEMLSGDVGVAAKLVQLANSALFGLRWPATTPAQAIQVLGTETTKALVLAAGLISRFDPATLAPYDLGDVWGHSREVGAAAGRIARGIGLNDRGQREAAMAGLLHDIGRLALIDIAPDRYRTVLARVAIGAESVTAAERAIFGTTHAEVGAYLLGLWGLPEAIMETVAWHHEPARCPGSHYDALTAVHVAEALTPGGDGATLDTDYLTRNGPTGGTPDWAGMLADPSDSDGMP